GASPNPRPRKADSPEDQKRTLYDQAIRRGYGDMASLLERRGANPRPHAMEPAQAFVDACLHLDTPRARKLLDEHPQLISSPGALHAAAALDRADAVAFILDLGASPNIPNPRSGNQLALHAAAWMDAPNALQVLIDRGGDVDRYEDTHGATPLGFAMY